MTDARLDADSLRHSAVTGLVSFGYRYRIDDQALRLVGGNAVNLHISLLPWNRGADPNLWSWLENTPRGVSVHWMAPAIDEGPLIAQQVVAMTEGETLRTSYERLERTIIELFGAIWPMIATGGAQAHEQERGGTSHRANDKGPHLAALHSGWDTPCGDVLEYGYRNGLWITD